MPPQPLWLLHLPRIIGELCRLPVPVLDRAVIEKLFGLKRRQAIQLPRFGGYQAGRTFLVDRQELLDQLEAIRDGETFRYEQRRRRRLVAEPACGRPRCAETKPAAPCMLSGTMSTPSSTIRMISRFISLLKARLG